MMRIQLAPYAGRPGKPEDTASVSGDVLTHNGTEYTLGEVEEGDVATPDPGEHPFTGSIKRVDGVLEFGLRMSYDGRTAESEQPVDPAHWLVEVEEGDVYVPIVRKPEPEEPVEEETQDDL